MSQPKQSESVGKTLLWLVRKPVRLCDFHTYFLKDHKCLGHKITCLIKRNIGCQSYFIVVLSIHSLLPFTVGLLQRLLMFGDQHVEYNIHQMKTQWKIQW